MKIFKIALKALILLSFLIFGTSSIAQYPVKNLDVKIMPSQYGSDIPNSHQLAFEIKVDDIFTQDGVVNAKGSTFGVYPSLIVVDHSGKLEGIQSLHTSQIELNFVVKNLFSGETIAVFTKSILGSGDSKERALQDAI